MKPKYKVGDEIIFLDGDENTTTAIILEVRRNMYMYDLYENGIWYSKHDGFSIEGLHLETRKMTKLEKAMK